MRNVSSVSGCETTIGQKVLKSMSSLDVMRIRMSSVYARLLHVAFVTYTNNVRIIHENDPCVHAPIQTIILRSMIVNVRDIRLTHNTSRKDQHVDRRACISETAYIMT